MKNELNVMKIFIATKEKESCAVIHVDGFKAQARTFTAPEELSKNTLLSALYAVNQVLDVVQAKNGKYLYEVHVVDILAKNIKSQTYKYSLATGVKASTGEEMSEVETAEWNKFVENNSIYTIFRGLNDLSYAYKERKFRNAMLNAKEKQEKILVSQAWEAIMPTEIDMEESNEAVPF